MKRGPSLLWLFALALFSKDIFAQAAGQQSPPPTSFSRIEPAQAAKLTLEEAWRLAEQNNPALRAALAGRMAAEGQVADSRSLLWNNPELSYENNRHRVPQPPAADQRYGEWTVGLSQTLEIAGQRRYRSDAALDDLAAMDASVAELRLQLRADVEEHFVKVMALQRRAAIETENLKLVESAAQALHKRVAAGETSKLDGNLAAIEAERTRNQLSGIDEQLGMARAELAQLLQISPGTELTAVGELGRSRNYRRDELLERAAQRPQLEVLAKRESAARNRLSLERASVYPDVTLGVHTSRDGPADTRDRILGFSVSVPLPLFKRNQAGIGKAMSEFTQAQIERQTNERDMRATALVQWTRHEQIKSRVERLKQSVLPPLDENLRLSRLAFQAGEIGVTELLLVNRQVLDGRRDALEAETELRLTQIALERATGWTP